MIDEKAVTASLQAIGLDHWIKPVVELTRKRLSTGGHGDFERWRDAVAAVAAADPGSDALRTALEALMPWRKGPLDIGGIHIDTEWRSDWKWDRFANAVETLDGRRVLDVGCGNGYYALRMSEAGAKTVIGIDPTILFVMQFFAINAFARNGNVHVLPLRMEELPLPAARFDTTFSMGVLYHRRDPIRHLDELRATLRPGGQLVLETIVVPGKESYACTPEGRYARMRNVWLLPTLAELTTWLQRTGYTDIDIVDTAITTTDEQRSTDWMRFESLAEALDPNDPSKTVEGWPAPHRTIVTAINPRFS